MTEKGWLIAWTTARAEKKVAARLAASGHETWLPLYRSVRRWSDRWKEVELPLFAGYCFTRPVEADWRPLLRTPGVLTLVKEHGLPARLDDTYVQNLRRTIEAPEMEPEPVETLDPLQIGDEVVVQEGALAGFRGVVRDVRSGRKLVVWISTIGRGVAFTIGSAQVRGA